MVDLILLYVQKTNSKVSIIFIKALLLHYYEPKKTFTCFIILLYTKEHFFLNIKLYLDKKPGLVVRAEDSRPRGRGFQSRRIPDGCKRC